MKDFEKTGNGKNGFINDSNVVSIDNTKSNVYNSSPVCYIRAPDIDLSNIVIQNTWYLPDGNFCDFPETYKETLLKMPKDLVSIVENFTRSLRKQDDNVYLQSPKPSGLFDIKPGRLRSKWAVGGAVFAYVSAIGLVAACVYHLAMGNVDETKASAIPSTIQKMVEEEPVGLGSYDDRSNK